MLHFNSDLYVIVLCLLLHRRQCLKLLIKAHVLALQYNLVVQNCFIIKVVHIEVSAPLGGIVQLHEQLSLRLLQLPCTSPL